MNKLYKNDKFWIAAGADHTFNCFKLMGGDCSVEVVASMLESAILNKENEVEPPHKHVQMLVDAWLEIRRMALEKGEQMENENIDFPDFTVEEFKQLYLILNPDASLYDLFSNTSCNNDVYTEFTQIFNAVKNINNLEELIHELSIFINSNNIKGTFGKNTQLVSWFYIQLTLILKGFSPIISFVERYQEMLETFPATNLLYGEIIMTQKDSWIKGENFNYITNHWIRVSKEYLEHIEKNYV
ncbi:hypothetical protein [Spiroplasma sp. BIUS-1]|uniref:hypothetical protein n=1 Tax=Spiroplasma sp. BIUS-1 TaxID=216964 RepID=UPI0013982855|nr:hypothetical protein [Spiroplasma sp. BIUS-1]QHX36811.1 hypothetical protein SBIUS_v1c05580 [Spiroplasma sp. BIUS-1]